MKLRPKKSRNTAPPPRNSRRNSRRWARPSIRELNLRSTRGMGTRDAPYEFAIGYSPKS